MSKGAGVPRDDLKEEDKVVLIQQLSGWATGTPIVGELLPVEEQDPRPIDLRVLLLLAEGRNEVEIRETLQIDPVLAMDVGAKLWNQISFGRKATPETLAAVVRGFDDPVETVDAFYEVFMETVASEERSAAKLFSSRVIQP